MDPLRPGAPAPSDAVVGVFDRDRLSEALAATHRAGFGPHARVLDGARGDVAGQLRRAGVGLSVPLAVDRGTVLILVNAPGRAALAADTFARVGARQVLRGVRPGVAPSPLPTADAPAPNAEADALGT